MSLKSIKRISTFVFIMVLLLCIGGCSSLKPLEEKDIVSSVKEHPVFKERLLLIDKVEISKRQTNTDNKEDLVYVDISGHNDLIKCSESYLFKYIYYDKGGWQVDRIDPVNEATWKVTPLTGVTDDTVRADFSNSANLKKYITSDVVTAKNIGKYIPPLTYNEIAVIEKNTDLDAGLDEVKIELQKNTAMADITTTVSASYNFDKSSGSWKLNSMKVVDNLYKWNISGKWRYNTPNNRGSYELDIKVSDNIQSMKGTLLTPYFSDGKNTPRTGTISRVEDTHYNVDGVRLVIYYKDPVSGQTKHYYGFIYLDREEIRISKDSTNAYYFDIKMERVSP